MYFDTTKSTPISDRSSWHAARRTVRAFVVAARVKFKKIDSKANTTYRQRKEEAEGGRETTPGLPALTGVNPISISVHDPAGLSSAK